MNDKNDQPSDEQAHPEPANPWVTPPPETGAKSGERSTSPWLPENAPPASGDGNGRMDWRGGLDKMTNLGSGNFSPFAGAGWWLWIPLAGVAAWIGFTGMHRVQDLDQGVVLSMGRYERTMGPGVVATWPAPFGALQVVPTNRPQSISFGGRPGGEGLVTADGTIVDAIWSVRWHVKNPRDFVLNVDNAEGVLQSLAAAAMTREIGSLTFAQTQVRNRRALEAAVYTSVQERLDHYRSGIVIDAIDIREIQAPAALAEEYEKIDDARDAASRALTAAQAAASQARTRARNETAEFDVVFTQYQAAPEVTRARIYYDTMERVMRRANLVIAPPGTPVPAPTAQPPAETPATGETENAQ